MQLYECSVYNVCVIFTSPANHFEACSTEVYGAHKTMESADFNDEEESEPEMEPVESENSSTTNPNREFRNCKV